MASIFGGVDGTCYFCRVKAEIMENMSKREANWQESYKELLAYVEEHGQLPNKKKADKRGLLNWWKYNKKLMKAGKLDDEHMQLLIELSDKRRVHLLFADESGDDE